MQGNGIFTNNYHRNLIRTVRPLSEYPTTGDGKIGSHGRRHVF
jgi:hypothetical protein